MDINFLIQVLERRIIILNNAKSQAAASGDLDTYNTVDQELLGVQTTLAQLQGLTSASTDTLAATTVQGPSASAVVNGYDISAYATDPLYEQKIMSILAAMPAFAQASDLTAYIQSAAPGAPVSGDMIFAAAQAYNVDIPLMVAIMRNDSQFGTQGIGASTYNPGNVGNTGYATQTYPSWDAGVLAVAEWLNNHRVSSTTAVAASSTTNNNATTTTASTTAGTSSATTTSATTTAASSAQTQGSTTSNTSVATSADAAATSTAATVDTTIASSTSATSTDSTSGIATLSASSSVPVDTDATSTAPGAATSTADADYATTTPSTGN